MESPNCFTVMYRQVGIGEVNQKRKSSQTIINSQKQSRCSDLA